MRTQPLQVLIASYLEPEHVARIRLTDPRGKTHDGQSEIEVFLNGRYAPYGFEAQQSKGGLSGRGVL